MLSEEEKEAMISAIGGLVRAFIGAWLPTEVQQRLAFTKRRLSEFYSRLF